MKPIYTTPLLSIQVGLGLAFLALIVGSLITEIPHLGLASATAFVLMLFVDAQAGGGPLRERKLLAEIRRLRAGLRFYAQQDHMILGGWDEPDEPGWLCPPGTKEDMIEEAENGLPWMVEDGGIARLILRGGEIVKEGGGLIARMDPKGRRDENGRTLIDCFKLSKFSDQFLILRSTDSIQHLADNFGDDTRPLKIEPIKMTKQQLRELPEFQS